MNNIRDSLLERIKNERERQYNLPFSEYDLKNTPSDWISIIGHYIFRETSKNRRKPNLKEFEDNLIKASAVILAALENIDNMKKLFNE